jgi:hypothetical protein
MASIAISPMQDVGAGDIHLQAEPNGLAFDPHARALFVVDAHGGAVFRVIGDRSERFATIPLASGDRLAAIAATPQGTLYVTRVGDRGAGAIFEVEPNGRIKKLDVSTASWRLGLAYDASEHALYCTQFVKPAGKACDGAIARVDLASGATTIALHGLIKPVGIVKLGPILLVSEACRARIYELDLDATPRACNWSAVPDRPDSLCAYDGRSVLLTTYDLVAERGALCRMWLDGRMQTLATGTWQPRGVTCDHARAYVSVRRGGRVLVIPIDRSGSAGPRSTAERWCKDEIA